MDVGRLNMRSLHSIRRIAELMLVSVLTCAALASCTNSTCIDNANSLPLAAFYYDGSQVTVNNLTVYGINAPGDTLMADNESLSQVYLPLRSTVEQTQYVLNYGGEINDTLTFNYTALPFFHSVECGAMYNFDVKSLTYTQNAIDSVVMTSQLITNVDVVNIKIYVKQ